VVSGTFSNILGYLFPDYLKGIKNLEKEIYFILEPEVHIDMIPIKVIVN